MSGEPEMVTMPKVTALALIAAGRALVGATTPEFLAANGVRRANYRTLCDAVAVAERALGVQP